MLVKTEISIMVSSTSPWKFLLGLDFIDKRKFESSESKDYMERSGKGLTNSLALSTKGPNKKTKVKY